MAKQNFYITVVQHGGFKKANSWLERQLEKINFGWLDKYGKMGVEALRAATPKDTGFTADSWTYEIHRTEDEVRIEWHNTNFAKDWFPVVIGLQLGHATKNGGWVEGTDFINPALKPIFEEIKNKISKEVKTH